MKKILCIVSMLVLCSAVSMAGLLSFGVQGTVGGISVEDPLKEVYNSGFGGGAHVDLELPILIGLRLSGDYIVFSADADKYKQALATLTGRTPSGFNIDGGNIKILAFSLNGKLSLPTPVLSPYATAGIGTASFSGGDATVTYNGIPVAQAAGVKTETASTVNIGAGVDWKLILTLYLEAKYTLAFTSGGNSSFVLASLGITF